MENKQLMNILDTALAKNKKDGIDLKDSYQMMKVLDSNNTNIYQMVEVIKNSDNSYKIIPKEGYQIHLLGQDSDRVGIWNDNYYLVISEMNQLAICVSYQESQCCGSKAISVDKVPNYLLVRFRGKILSGQN